MRGDGKLSAAEILVAISQLAAVFRAADGDTAFATFEINRHRETWPVRSKGFRRWLVGEFYKVEQKPPGGQAVADALGVIEARAQYAGVVHPVHVRVAGDDDTIYIDLVNEAWQVVEVTAVGWRVVSDPPVKFRRARGMLPLPTPMKGGAITTLRTFVNIAGDEQWALLVAWLVAAMRPSGPYPVLALLGEQGTAKSTTEELLRALIDPNVAPLRAEPMDVRDVMIAASNGWCIAFDNLSDIEAWLSDCLCRLATGGGFSTRELYSDGDEVIFVAQRPVMLNGIDAVISRADLLDRALIIDLPRIGDDKRRQRREFWSEFEAQRPALLGALLDVLAGAIKQKNVVFLRTLPRMADFAVWAVAAEPGLGLPDGAFMKAYSGNRDAAHDLALEASPIASAIRTLAAREAWKGTAAELLEELSRVADEAAKRAKSWPSTARTLGSSLRRVAPSLRAVGVIVEFSDEPELGARRRQIAVRKGRESSVPTVLERSGASVRNDAERSRNDQGICAGTAQNVGNDEIPIPSGHDPVTELRL
jgi:hypothetical protein